MYKGDGGRESIYRCEGSEGANMYKCEEIKRNEGGLYTCAESRVEGAYKRNLRKYTQKRK
jgi:hypothetical protein